MPLPDDLTKTTQADLENLVDGRESEGPHLDFKAELPQSWNDKAKSDLTSDVSAFANAGGGLLIFGIAQDGEGCATALALQAFNPDSGAMQIESILRDGVEPRMPGVRVQAVPLMVGEKTGFVVLVSVPQSWAGPHRTKLTKHFYLRDGKQSRPVDVPELRGLFLRSETVAQRVRDFRTERISRILVGETPRRLHAGVIALLHLVPTQAAFGTVSIDPHQYDIARNASARRLPLIGSATGFSRLVLEGASYVRPAVHGTCAGYSLLFRNGFFEAVTAFEFVGAAEALTSIYHQSLEHSCVDVVERLRRELDQLGVSRELTVMLSLLNANRGVLDIKRYNYSLEEDEGFFDRPHVLLPDVLIESETPTEAGMQQVFDLMWQACNLDRSPNFDRDGKLIRRS